MIQLKYQVREGGIPILKNDQIDNDAEYVLGLYDRTLLTDPHPLDVEDFTERLLGFNIDYMDITNNESIWGMMVYNNRNVIVYDREAKDIRLCPVAANTVVLDNSLLDEGNEFIFRSTMMHECGHGLYHRQIFCEDDNQLSLFPELNDEKIAITACRSSDIQGTGKHSLVTKHDWIEHHAKYFSAATLMPKSAMKIICGDESLRNRLRDEAPGFETSLLASIVSDTFNVSSTSALIRINQLGFGFDKGGQHSLFAVS